MRATFGLGNQLVLTAGEQPFTLADTLRPALTECFAGAAHMMGRTHQVLEGVFEVAVEVAPVSSVQLQTLKNLRNILGNCPFLVFTQDASTPVDKFDVIGEQEGQASEHILARIACERLQLFWLLILMVG